MVATVKFNVGGRHFEVSRALIDANPDSMLANMISEKWENNPEKPMFIARDGHLFAQVLNFLRYGSIELPIVTPKAMFLRELDYYGIAVESGSVTQVKKKTFAEMSLEMTRQHMECKVFFLAIELHHMYYSKMAIGNTTSTKCLTIALSKDSNTELYETFGKSYLDDNAKNTLNKYLGDWFGLTSEKQVRPNQFHVSIKK